MGRPQIELWTEGSALELAEREMALGPADSAGPRTLCPHTWSLTFSGKRSRLRRRTRARPFPGQGLLITQLRPSVLLLVNLGEACDPEQLSGDSPV